MLIHDFLSQNQFCYINPVFLLVLCIDISVFCVRYTNFRMFHCMKLTEAHSHLGLLLRQANVY